ncbi:SCO2583 family membrane protein [Streptomyces antimicrobicus]|uniref:Uncharacterized protein n=1 Tax=Streptomyces antimicrobicus TaxID=2883108 RepID=A0ABS8B0S1_9ACTN|nr:hypothetical protein [Streptomyces antimicrobicus]MCB5178191.1 hypothetical protein [Streptomyces antimicrobicus]
MAVPGDSPDGTPEDEYRSVVFDEDFVRAARLQEFSAQERMGEHARAVRSRSLWSGGRGSGDSTPSRRSRQGLLLVFLIALTFAAAVFMGMRTPYVPPVATRPEPLTSTVVPLAASRTVPGGGPSELYAQSPAAGYRVGAAGITLPAVHRTGHFTDGQVLAALSIAKDYLVQSSLDPDVLAGTAVRPVRVLLDPDQVAQFERSMTDPAGDGQHAATGWLVRFDPATAVVADSRVRVNGTLAFREVLPDVLEVTTDHTFVYAVRPAAAGSPGAADGASLFTVRRELRLRFDRDDLVARRAELRSAYVMAGPQACSAEVADGFRPQLAGAQPTAVGPAASDPYASGHPRRAAGLCGVLAEPGAEPPDRSPAPSAPSAPAAPSAG